MANHQDPYRPEYHFAPHSGWINDPNGLVYFRGKWHLFYQYYNPVEIDGMQWGHAISDDLMRWEHLPPAIKPDTHGQIWSGSAIVDHHDASGLFHGKDGIICYFTYWDKSDGRQCQGMAYSEDGRQFITYAKNPIIPQLRNLPGHPDDKEFRDPKVFWHEPTGKWVMAVAGGRLRLFTSTDLINWKFESVSDTINTECPDLFELPVDGNASDTRWVLSYGGRTYHLGLFDGVRFTPQGESFVMSNGPDFYASQSWSDAPDNRRIIISWIFGWGYGCKLDAGGITAVFPTEPRAGGCLTLPYELSLKTADAGVRLCMLPVPEFDRVRQALHPPTFSVKQDITLNDGKPVHIDTDTHALDIRFSIRQCRARRVGVRIATASSGWIAAGYDQENRCLFIDRRSSGSGVQNYAADYVSSVVDRGTLPGLRILVDRSSIEVFTTDGLSHLSAFILADPDHKGLLLQSHGGDAKLEGFTAHHIYPGSRG